MALVESRRREPRSDPYATHTSHPFCCTRCYSQIERQCRFPKKIPSTSTSPSATVPPRRRRVYCPYCNETVEIAIDPGGGPSQQYVEDCEVCCQPWTVNLHYNGDGTAKVSVTPLDQ